MRRSNRVLGCATLLLATTLLPAPPVHACLNDRDSDSLAAEGGDLPDVVRVITGRFERNPPQFYELRLKRVAAEISRTPDVLNLYDDAAVACDRLGRDDEAIIWITKKRARLEEKDRNQPEIKEHWYRYYANIGTFRAHRWLRAGASVDRVGEMKQAQNEIAKALQLKPNAHFNREPYQLKAMEWIILAVQGKAPDHYGDHTLGAFLDVEHGPKALPAIEGLSGLIVLGNAWESVDISDALELSLVRSKRVKIGYLALLRVRELVKQGKRSLSSSTLQTSSDVDRTIGYRPPTNIQTIEEKYHELRVEAETWQRERTAYMTARFAEGRHPDIDPTFWNEYHPAAPPSLDVPWLGEASDNFQNWFFLRYGFLSVLFLTAAMLGVIEVVRRVTRYYRSSRFKVG